jgi:hypothetical protein
MASALRLVNLASRSEDRFMRSENAALVAPLIFAMSLAAGCSRQPSAFTSNSSPPNHQQLPFENVSSEGGESPTASLASSTLPAGTLLTVRLQTAVSSATSHPGDSFDALLDEPVVIEGQTLVVRGIKAMGKVTGARASSGLRDPGYLRLVLTSISVNARSVSLQTSSVFEKGNSPDQRGPALLAAAATAQDNDKKDVKFPAQWRLTFRLTQPLSLAD